METTKEILTDEELSTYRSLHDTFKLAEESLARTTSQLSVLESRKLSDINNYSRADHEYVDAQIELSKKYGEGIRINLSNGEIIRNDASNS